MRMRWQACWTYFFPGAQHGVAFDRWRLRGGDRFDPPVCHLVRNGFFVSSPDGKGLVSAHHPLYRGVFGFCGHASAEASAARSVCRLDTAVGASMGEWNTGGWSDSLLNERLVHIDESEDYLARTPMAKLHVRGSASAPSSCLTSACTVRNGKQIRSTSKLRDACRGAGVTGRAASVSQRRYANRRKD